MLISVCEVILITFPFLTKFSGYLFSLSGQRLYLFAKLWLIVLFLYFLRKVKKGDFMLFQVIGIRAVNFVDSKSGNTISGTTLYIGSKNDHVRGLECSKVFVKNSIDVSSLKINDMVNINYNMYGKVDSVEIVEK